MISLDADQKAKLMNDLRVVIDDAQELLRMTADQVGESAVGVRARVEARLADATRDLQQRAVAGDGLDLDERRREVGARDKLVG